LKFFKSLPLCYNAVVSTRSEVVASRIIVILALIANAPWLATPSWLAFKQKPIEASPAGSAPHQVEAEALYQQARSLIDLGKYGFARVKLSEAVRLWQQAKQPERAAQALLDVGQDHSRAGRWQDALQCYYQLLRLQPLALQTNVRAFNAMARLYVCLGQLDLATRYYQQALTLAPKIQDRSEPVEVSIGLATVYAEQGQFELARIHLEQAQQGARRTGDEKAMAAALLLTGRICRHQGQPDKAHEAVQQALALYRNTGDQEGEVQSLCFLSDLCLRLGQTQAALEHATQAQARVTQLKAIELKWRGWFALARAQRAAGRVEDAGKSYFRAVGLIESQRLLHSADPLRIAFLAERQAVYREFADFLIERGRAEEAFTFVEYARARATLDLLAQARESAERSETAAPREKLEDLAQRVDRLRTEARSPQLNHEQRDRLQAELKETEQRLEEARLEADLERRRRFTRPASLQQVQQTMLRPGDILLEFFLGEKRSYVWFISPEQTRCAALLGQKEIEDAIKLYLEVITIKPNALHLEREIAKQTTVARRLFDLLLGPLVEHLSPSQRLIIAPDGLLYYLPFETLIRDGRSLIEDHEISYVPSASALGLLQQANNREAAADGLELLAVGDPAFGPPLEAEVSKHQRPDADNIMREIWSASGYRLPPLLNARREVQAISEFSPPERRQIYLGASATEEAIKRELQRQYRRLHFAMHSLIDEQIPARSGVVLTLDDDPAEDGLLDVNEIAELRLDCDLVVLSACQTGRGRLVNGEGIVGLARAFLVAGGRSVAVSLWSVSDRSTAQLMKDFYRHLAAGSDATAALRQAKLEMLRSRTVTRHPYYWAAFVLVGKAGGPSVVPAPATSDDRDSGNIRQQQP
jgi:CHAT domain-containing protein/tetratricopeptide (TPR) repeat protein